MASVRPDHLLARLASESLGKLRHVRHHVVDAEDGQRVWVGGNRQTRYLRPDIGAPRVGEGKEEALAIGPAIRTFVVDRLALLLEFALEGVQRDTEAAVVRRILALGQQAILLDPGASLGDVLRVPAGGASSASV